MKRLGMLFALLLFAGAVNANGMSPPLANANAEEDSQVQNYNCQKALANDLQSNVSINATNAEIAKIDNLNTFTTLQVSGVAVLQNLQNAAFCNRVGFVKNAQNEANLIKNGRANDIKNLAQPPGGKVSFDENLNLFFSEGTANRGAIMLSKWPIANSEK